MNDGARRGEPSPAKDRERLAVDYRLLMKKVEGVVDQIDRGADGETAVRTVADTIIGQFRDELGIYGGRLYRRRGRTYFLEATFGDAKPLEEGLEVPASYTPIAMVLEQRAVYMELGDERLDPQLEAALGVEKFAAIELGDGNYILSFDLAPGYHREDVLYSLGILRHAINQRVREERWAGIFRQARRIQASILPRRAPDYHGFDIHGRNEPLESVGGDFYGYIPITDKILGVAIADVSGHGLPAALQVRDIHMGLRMGLSRDMKIVRTVERLNAIIHGSTLTSRFVSMFYGELEPNGLFIYVNAGHPPPFHLSADGAASRLTEGGAVLGPLADATYERGFVRLSPGDVLVLYTDGIVETRRRPGLASEEYGGERLVELVREHRRRPAAEIVDAIFHSVRDFCRGCPAEDDRTVVVLRLPEGQPG